MRETRADTSRAVGLALLLHALVFLAMFAGLWWTKTQRPAAAAAGPVSAELVDVGDLSRAMQRTLADRPEPAAEAEPLPQPVDEPAEEPTPAALPQPVPEPAPQDEVAPPQRAPQDFIPNPQDRSQEAVVQQPTPKPAVEAKPQEAQRRQEQVDLTEQKRQQEAERRQRLAKQEEEQRQKQLAELKRQRALAARDAKVARAELDRIANARAAEEASRADAASSGARAGGGGVDQGLLAQYIAALQAAINAKWTRPESVPVGAPCRLVIRQSVGGNVMDVQIGSPCAYDEAGQESVKRAVLKADPLPYAGFEAVFNRNLTINFRAQDR